MTCTVKDIRWWVTSTVRPGNLFAVHLDQVNT